jgi:hypothetical protein
MYIWVNFYESIHSALVLWFKVSNMDRNATKTIKPSKKIGWDLCWDTAIECC